MGITTSSVRYPDTITTRNDDNNDDIWWTNGQVNRSNKKFDTVVIDNQSLINQTAEPSTSSKLIIKPNSSLNQLSEKNQKILNEFKFDMERKHEKRREILDAKKKEFDDLRQEVARLKQENDLLKSSEKKIEQIDELSLNQSKMERIQEENEKLKSELKDKSQQLEELVNLAEKNRELQKNIAEMQEDVQQLNGTVVEFENEKQQYKAHVVALKDVIAVSKKMLLIRESQLKELKQKVEIIEKSLSTTEINLLSQNLREEYEKQLQSIRNLKVLYEERQRSDQQEKEKLKRQIDNAKKELENQEKKYKEAEERITELENSNSDKYDEIKSLESNLGLAKAESRQFKAELTVINQLFSEILLGFNSSQDIDLDKLIKQLEDHHELLQNIVVNETDSSEAVSALPKVLLDLVNQMNEKQPVEDIFSEKNTGTNKLETIIEETDSQNTTDQFNSPEEIVALLPKVWRVLIELLSHQKAPTNILTSPEGSMTQNPCYKTVQTPKGPSLVLSVSQTFIRLKDLILEKKSLEKETGHLKHLNSHLENRLQDQEKRLEMVSSELNKTWHVVGKMQKQHQLLHTQEKILRYELAQKRKLLNTLKEELEYSREKWQEAREKNSKTETEWKQLRVEFATRRLIDAADEFNNNSQESGYSDDRCSTSSSSSPSASSAASDKDDEDDDDDDDDDENIYEIEILTKPKESTDAQETIQQQRSNAQNFVSSIIEAAINSILQNENSSQTQKTSAAPSISSTSTISKSKSDFENFLIQKEERLKRLESQCNQLTENVVNTTSKSINISNKLDSLHKTYGKQSQDTDNNNDEQTIAGSSKTAD